VLETVLVVSLCREGIDLKQRPCNLCAGKERVSLSFQRAIHLQQPDTNPRACSLTGCLSFQRAMTYSNISFVTSTTRHARSLFSESYSPTATIHGRNRGYPPNCLSFQRAIHLQLRREQGLGTKGRLGLSFQRAIHLQQRTDQGRKGSQAHVSLFRELFTYSNPNALRETGEERVMSLFSESYSPTATAPIITQINRSICTMLCERHYFSQFISTFKRIKQSVSHRKQ
jgi:hypothetical protein